MATLSCSSAAEKSCSDLNTMLLNIPKGNVQRELRVVRNCFKQTQILAGNPRFICLLTCHFLVRRGTSLSEKNSKLIGEYFLKAMPGKGSSHFKTFKYISAMNHPAKQATFESKIVGELYTVSVSLFMLLIQSTLPNNRGYLIQLINSICKKETTIKRDPTYIWIRKQKTHQTICCAYPNNYNKLPNEMML